MSTKNVTNSTASYDPTAIGDYNSVQPSILSGLNLNMANPWQAMAGNQQLAAGNQNLFGSTQQMFQSLGQSWQNRNLATSSPLFLAQLARMRNVAQGQQAGVYGNLLLNAQNLRTGSANAASMYQPLLTGSTNTTQTGGWGSYI